MKTIGAFEAKTHLSGLLDKVARGESFLITKRGKPIASLTPLRSCPQAAKDIIGDFRREFASSLKKFSQSEIREMRDAGRK